MPPGREGVLLDNLKQKYSAEEQEKSEEEAYRNKGQNVDAHPNPTRDSNPDSFKGKFRPLQPVSGKEKAAKDKSTTPPTRARQTRSPSPEPDTETETGFFGGLESSLQTLGNKAKSITTFFGSSDEEEEEKNFSHRRFKATSKPAEKKDKVVPKAPPKNLEERARSREKSKIEEQPMPSSLAFYLALALTLVPIEGSGS